MLQSHAPLPDRFHDVAHLEEVMTAPSAALTAELAAIAGDLIVLGGCVAALERTRIGRGTASLVILTFVLPGSTLAIALLITYGRWIGGTLLIILLAYLAKLWAFAHRPISGALDRLPPDELAASRISGASLGVAIRTVVLRPLAPAFLVAWLVCFLTALHEVIQVPWRVRRMTLRLTSSHSGAIALTAT